MMLLTQSGFVTGPVAVAIHPKLIVESVDMILGNNLADGQVFPAPSFFFINLNDIYVSEPFHAYMPLHWTFGSY